jgi:hypothetical protein
MNVLGALDSAKGMIINLYNPSYVLNAVFHLAILILKVNFGEELRTR